MRIKTSIVAIFPLLFLVLGAFTAQAKVHEELVVECRLIRQVEDEVIAGFYRITRYGDSLFGEYKHQAEDDLVRTDDVYYKQYARDTFGELEANGTLDNLERETNIPKEQIRAIRYWGIDEDDNSNFQMQLWLVITDSNQRIVANWQENAFKSCQPSR
jgi:hypothetical protein